MSSVLSRPVLWLVLSCCSGAFAAPSSLDAFVASVAQAAPSIAVHTEALRRAEADARVASARPAPELILGTENLPVTGADAFALRADPMTMVRFGLMQEVLPRARRERRGDVARQRVTLAAITRSAAIVALTRSIADAANRGQAAMAAIERIAGTRAVLQDIRARAAAQWTSGQGDLAMLAEVDTMLVDLDDASDEQAMVLQEARAALIRWVGVDRVDEALSLDLPESPDIPVDAERDWQARITSMPGLQLAEVRKHIAEVEAAEARQWRRPAWSWEFTVADRGPQADDMVSLMVRIPLQRPGVQRARLDAATAKLSASEAAAQDVRNELAAMLEADRARWRILERRHHRLVTTQWPLAQDRRDLARLDTVGEGTALDGWLAAEWALHGLALARINLESERRQLAVSLRYRTIEVQP